MGELLIGWASRDITPKQRAYLCGQSFERLSTYVRDPLEATVLAMELSGENGSGQLILVSCDLAVITRAFHVRLRERLAARLPDFDPAMLVVCATHTHNAPFLSYDQLDPFLPGVFPSCYEDDAAIAPERYEILMLDALSDAAEEAWRGRKPGHAGAGFGYAAVGHNRRTVYRDGSAMLYGNARDDAFDHIEGNVDHGIELLYVWDERGELTGIVVNIACPPQIVEGESFISADYWGDVRRRLREAYGPALFVLPLLGAAGDIAPRGDAIRKGEQANPDLRDGLAMLGKRIVQVIEEQYDSAQKQIMSNPVFSHSCAYVPLRRREPAPLDFSLIDADYTLFGMDEDQREQVRRHMLRRQEDVRLQPEYDAELHVIRLGDIAIVTNPFELFGEYGARLKARSPADQTFIVQLACDAAGYLPTSRAVAGRGYSALPLDGLVGPEGGRQLVAYTVEEMRRLWRR